MVVILFPFLSSLDCDEKTTCAEFFSPLTDADYLFHSISQAVIRINWLKTSITTGDVILRRDRERDCDKDGLCVRGNGPLSVPWIELHLIDV